MLPAGTGKNVRVCVFADSFFHKDLLEAGADIIGTDQILIDIANDKIEFDKLIFFVLFRKIVQNNLNKYIITIWLRIQPLS